MIKNRPLRLFAAVAALLLYIKSDFTKGLQIVYDLNKRVYGSYKAVPDNFDPRKVMDNYKSPLTGI